MSAVQHFLFIFFFHRHQRRSVNRHIEILIKSVYVFHFKHFVFGLILVTLNSKMDFFSSLLLQ